MLNLQGWVYDRKNSRERFTEIWTKDCTGFYQEYELAKSF